MGCCWTREENAYDYDSDVNERSQLIVPINADPPEHTISSSPPLTSFLRTNEQDVLSRILHQTATAFIDISVMDGGALYQQEQRTRAVKYSEKLDGFLSNISIPASPLQLPIGVVNPMPVLMSPISSTDIDLVSALAVDLRSALESIKVQPVNDLCVGF